MRGWLGFVHKLWWLVGEQGEFRLCLWGQSRGQKVRLVPQRIKMDKQKALALLCGVVSQEPPTSKDLCSLFLGLREVRAKEGKGSGVKGKVRQLSKAWLLRKPLLRSEGGKATVAMLWWLGILKLLILTSHEHNDSCEGFWCMLDTLITPSPQDLFCAHTSLLFSSKLCVCVWPCLFYYMAVRDSSASEAVLPSHTSPCVSICGLLCAGECVWSKRACSWA